jgi:hypothetical protein
MTFFFNKIWSKKVTIGGWLFFLIVVFKYYYDARNLSRHQKFTIVYLTHNHFTVKGGRRIDYEYFVNDNRYTVIA